MRTKSRTLRPVHPNVGIEAEYHRKLDRLIAEMHRSLVWWLSAAYRANEGEIAALAADKSPIAALREAVARLRRRWQRQFDELALELARWFATAAVARSDAALSAILRKGGMSVKFRMTRAANEAYQATLAENVSLIKSIAAQHLAQVEGMVMRSVQAGRDLGSLTADLHRQFGVTRRRAGFIARDQNNKATAVIMRVRHQELGIRTAIWLHSHGGKEPRKTHLANSGKPYAIAEGWFDPDPKVRRNIWPGELISCRCVSKPVIEGFS